MTFVGLMVRNLRARRGRTLLTAIAVAIGVATGVTLGIVTASLRSTAVSILRIGSADFSVTQKGVSDVLNSAMDEEDVRTISSYPDVESAVGVLVATVKLNEDNPLFLEIGIEPDKLEEFGVNVVQGQAYTRTATDEVMLGYRAARNLGKQVGDTIVIDGDPYRVVGIFSTGQEFGDAGSMFPLVPLQARERKAGGVTIAFVRTKPGTDIDALRARIEHDNATLVTVRTAQEFGRADRNLQLITAADRAATILALTIGAIIVTNSMLLSFIERIREFGVLRAVGWSSGRIASLVIGEAVLIGFTGAGIGVALSFVATRVLQDLPGLVGILHPEYTPGVFLRALGIAIGMTLLGSQYPALRATRLAPLEALRRE